MKQTTTSCGIQGFSSEVSLQVNAW